MASNDTEGLITDPNGQTRCFWPGDKQDYLDYHDTEWGFPEDDDFKLFEKICLEGFQSGLSWLTILRKREAFRQAFADFDFGKVAKFGEPEIEQLVENAGIIRHRGKIKSVINNANRAIEMRDEFGSLGSYFWQYEPDERERPDQITFAMLATELNKTDMSTKMSKDLKKRGWSFVGPTTAYSFMQAMGMVNDHLDGCGFREPIERARQAFNRPNKP